MRLHLVDGTYELFRAHFSKRPGRTDPAGRDVKATVGLVGSMLQLLADEDEAVTHVAVAFDRPIESFRNERFPGYKDSTGVDPDLLAQFEGAEEAVAALGVGVWSMAEHEADDAMATGATRFGGEVEQVRLLTPDKDLGQMVRGEHVVQVDRLRERIYDEAGVVERLGVPPASVPDLLALVGDTADGIPGLPGFGAKTASSLLTRYGHLEDIPRDGSWDVDVRGAARLAGTLDDRFDDALLYRELATLVTEVPLPHATLDELAWAGVPRERFLAWCRSTGVDTLRSRPVRWA